MERKNVKLENYLNIISYTKLNYDLMKEINFNTKSVSISSITQKYPIQNIMKTTINFKLKSVSNFLYYQLKINSTYNLIKKLTFNSKSV